MKNNQMLIDGELYDSETGELINKVEQVEIEIVENNLPDIICNGGTHIKTNTEQLKRELIVYLEKYDVEVTEDTEKDCSKMATELNKIAGNLDKKRKETSALIKKPADDLKVAVDELIAIVQNKRKSILDGVEVFKQKRFDLIRELLKAKITELYETYRVSEKYQVCNIEPLVLEGSLAKTNLSKSALESLEAMVMKVKRLEDAITIREMQLELKCNNAGLITPIELKEIEHIIELDNYDELLEDMINKRIEIQEQVERQIDQQEQQRQEMLKQEEIRKEKEQVEKEERERHLEEQKRLQEQQDKLKQEQETGKKKVTLVATFEVEVNVNVEDNKVWFKYVVELQKQFKTFVNLEIKKEDEN